MGWPDNAVPFLYPLWYLRDLLILNFLAAIIWKLVDKLPEIMLIGALSLWICYSIPNCAVPDYQAIAFWIFGAYLVKRNISLELLDKIPAWLLGTALVLCIWRYMQFRYVDEFLPLFNVCISLSLCFSFVLSGRIKAGKLKNALLKLSAYSFSIYLFHEFTLLLFRKVAASVFPLSDISQFLQYMLIPFVVSAFCVILSIILKKLMPRFYAILVGGRT
ncbi:MAG: acyltransferase family protein [Oscillospiraceae bacterium]|nr:acyltransferase family protein [Oscillospiraceae bacterium]